MNRDELAAAALQEKARREKARRRLLAFCAYMMRQYPVRARHLQLLCGVLEDVERYVATRGREGSGRVMVMMPPRYWKSMTGSRLFPAWFLGRNPDFRTILTSYTGDLAFKHSRGARDFVLSPQFARVFGQQSAVEQPVELDGDSRSVRAWDLSGHAGGLTAAGVGGGITGVGAHLLIIDDPVKDREQAESESYRERAWDWYTDTAYTRLEDGGAILVIMTRWHTDDLAGRLLRQMIEEPGGDQWRVILLPARAEEYSADEREKEPWLPERDLLGRAEGEPLWPEKHTAEQLTALEVNVGPYGWPSLYQQRPRAKEGQMFKRSWFQVVDMPAVPSGLRWVRYWDLGQVSDEEARKEKKDPSYSGSLAGAVDAEGNLWLRDMVRGRWEWPDAQAVIKATMLVDGGVRHGVESKLHGKTAVQEFLRDAELLTVALEAINVEGGAKETRALALQTRAHAGKVFLVRGQAVLHAVIERLAAMGRRQALDGLAGGAWTGPYLDEMCDFPAGRHDDQVDMTTGAMQMLGLANEVRVERVTGDVARVLSDWRG